jgi:hypothetical protein
VAAIDILFGIEPLHQVMVRAAAAAAHRLACELKWKEGIGHTRFLSGILADPIFRMREDKMPGIRALNRDFKMHITRLEDWEGPKALDRARDVWFTDGFKSDTSSGAGIVCHREEVAKSLPLDGYAKVLQTEIVAILRCAHLALERRGTGRRIRICSDSQAAIKAFEAPICTSRLV